MRTLALMILACAAQVANNHTHEHGVNALHVLVGMLDDRTLETQPSSCPLDFENTTLAKSPRARSQVMHPISRRLGGSGPGTRQKQTERWMKRKQDWFRSKKEQYNAKVAEKDGIYVFTAPKVQELRKVETVPVSNYDGHEMPANELQDLPPRRIRCKPLHKKRRGVYEHRRRIMLSLATVEDLPKMNHEAERLEVEAGDPRSQAIARNIRKRMHLIKAQENHDRRKAAKLIALEGPEGAMLALEAGKPLTLEEMVDVQYLKIEQDKKAKKAIEDADPEWLTNPRARRKAIKAKIKDQEQYLLEINHEREKIMAIETAVATQEVIEHPGGKVAQELLSAGKAQLAITEGKAKKKPKMTKAMVLAEEKAVALREEKEYNLLVKTIAKVNKEVEAEKAMAEELELVPDAQKSRIMEEKRRKRNTKKGHGPRKRTLKNYR
eukprot:gnl/MRDRNA2_/MRDRNA2_95818_c0_seq1.p1 gnl/MRDRNA2_/MRDRNA2_95818_c0~~gnl/MRDRNA2_/MRDRNA2_95818_c0_seq1.p1  ORF type:complete len:437 (+),score=108.32 gnl/MRDRNA2_/MRDRNA2_95818_c0_seq1:100-1410(+)